MRLRKDLRVAFCYSVNMDVCISAKLTVDELLTTHPETATVLLSLRTSCVGCHLARFCTLEDVAKVYQLQLGDFLDTLQETIQFS